jgi:hypothetical protein
MKLKLPTKRQLKSVAITAAIGIGVMIAITVGMHTVREAQSFGARYSPPTH